MAQQGNIRNTKNAHGTISTHAKDDNLTMTRPHMYMFQE